MHAMQASVEVRIGDTDPSRSEGNTIEGIHFGEPNSIPPAQLDLSSLSRVDLGECELQVIKHELRVLSWQRQDGRAVQGAVFRPQSERAWVRIPLLSVAGIKA